MPQFKSKIRFVEAEIYDGTKESARRIRALGCACVEVKSQDFKPHRPLVVQTEKGPRCVHRLEWVLKTPEGFFFICNNGAFRNAYDPIDEEPTKHSLESDPTKEPCPF